MILTHRRLLYERLVMETQHVYRQQREFPKRRPNQYAHNLRLNPLAALIAYHSIPDAKKLVLQRQDTAFTIIQALNASRYTEPITFEKQGLRPSFFRLSAAWKTAPEINNLLSYLHNNNIQATIRNLPYNLLHHNPTLREHYRNQIKIPKPLTVAEEQIKRRFCIHTKQPFLQQPTSTPLNKH